MTIDAAGKEWTMSDTLLVALIGLAGSALGTLGGITLNSKMMSYRLEQLEARFDKITSTQSAMDSRLYALEKHNEVQDERQKVANKRLDDLEAFQKRVEST